MHIDKPQGFWENVLWTDETKLELVSFLCMCTCEGFFMERKMSQSFVNARIMIHNRQTELLTFDLLSSHLTNRTRICTNEC